MTQKKIEIVSDNSRDTSMPNEKLTYWRSSPRCFSIHYKGMVTEICEGDLGYGDMDRMDGAIHAAIGCKRNKSKNCRLREV